MKFSSMVMVSMAIVAMMIQMVLAQEVPAPPATIDESVEVGEACTGKCCLKNGMKETACQNQIKKNKCKWFWAGRGCTKTIVKDGKVETFRYQDGGCKPKGFCDFKCPRLCEEHKCFWNPRRDVCQKTEPVDYDYDYEYP